MARNSAAASTPASATSHKRQLSNGLSSTVTPSSRASKRLKQSAENTPTSTTPKKSKYFENPDSDEEEEQSSSDGGEESDFDELENLVGSETSTIESVSEDEDEVVTEDDSGEDIKKKKRGRATPRKPGVIANAIQAGKDLWREGVKVGLGPGKAVFIEKPKPRGDGGYQICARSHSSQHNGVPKRPQKEQ